MSHFTILTFFLEYGTHSNIIIVTIKCDIVTIIYDVIIIQYDVSTIKFFNILNLNKLIKIYGAKQCDNMHYHM
jgi:hypothetical protein